MEAITALDNGSTPSRHRLAWMLLALGVLTLNLTAEYRDHDGLGDILFRRVFGPVLHWLLNPSWWPTW
jgi:hypothetical protein